MASPIYKNPEKRKEYLRQYHAERRAKQKDSKEYAIRMAIHRIKKLRKEIGDYNTNRVIEVLEEFYRESVLPTEDSQE